MSSAFFRRIIATSVALAALAVAPAQAAGPPAGFRPFAPDSVWNLPLRPDAPISPDDARYQGWLQWDLTKGAWLNSTTCGMPLYWADANTPTVAVTLNHPSYQDPALMRAWSAVPIPADAQPANCSDHNFAVAQVQPNGAVREWEFWAATRRPDGTWVAQWGGAMADMRTDRGIASNLAWSDPLSPTWASRYASPSWNVTASSVSATAGVITQAELRAGHIDHAVAIALNDTAHNVWMWPAQRTDGGATDPNALPEGAHLRLPANLDLSTYNMVPAVRMIAEAAQKYGIIVRDRTYDKNVFYAEPPAAGQPDAVSSTMGGRYPDVAFRAFPWSKLQVLDAQRCTDWSGCAATPKAVINVDDAAGTPIAAGDTVTLDTSNSVLNQPRSSAAWDLDGDGTYETLGGADVKTTLRIVAPGTRTVGVQITTRDGAVARTSTSFTVAGTHTAPAASGVTIAVNTAQPAAARNAAGSASRASVPPPAAPASSPAGAQQPATPVTSAAVLVRQLPSSPGGKAVLPIQVACSYAVCAGRASVNLGATAKASGLVLRKGMRLGSTSYRVAAGQRATIRVTISARVAKVLRRARVTSLSVAQGAAPQVTVKSARRSAK